MEELKDFTLADLYDRLGWDDITFLQWLQNMKLIPTTRKCECGSKMSLRIQKEGRNYQNWRCTTNKCRRECGFLVGTFFEGSHLSLKEIFQMSYFWAHDICSEKFIQFQMCRQNGSVVDFHTIVDFKSFFREESHF